MTRYSQLADLIVVIHLAYVAYVAIGMVLIVAGIVLRWQWIRNVWFRGTHLIMLLIVAGEAIYGVTCPLTTWENELRKTAALPGLSASTVGLIGDPLGQGPLLAAAAYLPKRPSTFVGRLARSLFVFVAPDWVFTTGYVSAAVLVLGTLWLAPPRCKRTIGEPGA